MHQRLHASIRQRASEPAAPLVLERLRHGEELLPQIVQGAVCNCQRPDCEI